MKKKLLAMLLVVLMSVSLLVGCSGDSDTNSNANTDYSNDNVQKSEVDESEDAQKIIANRDAEYTISGETESTMNCTIAYDSSCAREVLIESDGAIFDGATLGYQLRIIEGSNSFDAYYQNIKDILTGESDVYEYTNVEFAEVETYEADGYTYHYLEYSYTKNVVERDSKSNHEKWIVYVQITEDIAFEITVWGPLSVERNDISLEEFVETRCYITEVAE